MKRFDVILKKIDKYKIFGIFGQGTEEEVRLNIASADLALSRGDVDHALAMLRAIGPGHQYYLQARDKMATIYLEHLKDKRMFAACYR